MDPIAEATTVAKDKFTLFVYCDATTLVSTFSRWAHRTQKLQPGNDFAFFIRLSSNFAGW